MKVEISKEFDRPVIIFDSECGLCSRVPEFVEDRSDDFIFTSLNSDLGREISEETDLSGETFMVLDGKELKTESDAAVRLLKALGGFWSVIGEILEILPEKFRDAVYRTVAANRYRIFGRSQEW